MNKWMVFIVFFVVGFGPLSAQKGMDKLKAKEKELLKKIENTKSLIKLTRNSEQITIAELAIINHQIAYREELLANINYQMHKLNNEIEAIDLQVVQMENNLNTLKEEYAKMLQFAYKNRNTDYDLLYVFAAQSYLEAYRRMKYLEQYTIFRTKQVAKIKETKVLLGKKADQLETVILEKEKLAQVQEKEKENFLNDKIVQQKALVQLQQNEQLLKNQLLSQEKKKEQLANAIRKAIEAEISAVSKKSGNKGVFNLTPEAAALAKTFSASKGKLPWPVSQGEITGRYGKHRHETVQTAYVNNKGIDITTTKEAEVRAMYKGKVSSVLIIPGAGKVVMISHGNYRSVYANLKEVYVAKGDKITTKQSIGKLLPASSGNISEAHLEIWKISSSGMQTENPALWIYK